MRLTAVLLKLGGAALAAVAMTLSVEAAEITGAGSTFVYPILSKWAADYSTKAGININYQSIGSGGGLAQIKAATVDFGASDAPMKPAELQKLGLGQFPLVIGGIAPWSISMAFKPVRCDLPARCWPTFTWERSRTGTIPPSPR